MRKVFKIILKVFGQVLLYAVILASSIVCLLRLYTVSYMVAGVLVNHEFSGHGYFIPMDHIDLLIRQSIFGTDCPRNEMEFVIIGVEVYSDNDIVPAEYETVKMGRYPQSGNGEEPIEWLIIDEKLGRTLLLSKYCLDAVPYDNKIDNISWERSYLRKWLNEDFYNRAFNRQEQKVIKATTMESDLYGFEDWEDGWKGEELPSKKTRDKVFILDKHEKLIYLKLTGNDSYARPTEYAKQNENIPNIYRKEWNSYDIDPDWTRFGAVPNIGDQASWSFSWESDSEYGHYHWTVNPPEEAKRYALYVRPAMWVDSSYVRKLKKQN